MATMPIRISSAKKIVLLVGVDKYPKANSIRKDESGNTVTISDLEGCENDILSLNEMLVRKYGIADVTIMISSCSPNAQSYQQPSYRNIENAFQKVTKTARKGDLFFFHFSGHGTRLPTTRTPPNGHTKDPSLLPMDFCQGQPAIRGWILNHWLRRLYEKGVEVVVSLDSCFSGGAWRTDGMKRTMDRDWKPPVNIDVDQEQALSVGHVPPAERNSVPVESWDINPYNFTLMAACTAHQTAQECRQVDGKVGGAFTTALVSHVETDTRLKTYRTVCTAIRGKFESQDNTITQTPMVYGHDRLQFFGTTEPCCAIPLYVRVEKGFIRIPEGKIHGVTPRTEYTRLSSDSPKLVIEEVEDTHCFVKIPAGVQPVWKSGDEIYRSRLSTTQPFRVLVDPSLPSGFNENLLKKLQQHIRGHVEVVAAYSHEDRGAAAVELKCTNGAIELHKLRSNQDRTRDKVAICKRLFRKSEHGNSDASEKVPGLELPYLKESESEQPVAPTASAIIHLLRYQQIIGLRDLATKTKAPFTIQLTDKGGSTKFSKGQDVFSLTEVRLIFKNLSTETLYFTVLTFGPGHHVRHLYPGGESSCRVAPGGTNQECVFKFAVPEKLQPGRYKDIVRTCVTKSSDVSLKGQELPDIWSEEQIFHSTSSPLRDVRLIEEFEWWIDDFEVWTRDRPDSRGN